MRRVAARLSQALLVCMPILTAACASRPAPIPIPATTIIRTPESLPLAVFEACLARSTDASLRGFAPDTRDGYQAAIDAALRRCQIEVCIRLDPRDQLRCRAAIAEAP
jgi:hypothetical protein